MGMSLPDLAGLCCLLRGALSLQTSGTAPALVRWASRGKSPSVQELKHITEPTC
jgi:hypothetical protein